MSIPPENTSLGASISEIIDRTTKIIHEEIELAKAEMAVAAQDLLRGSVAGIVGGVFAFFGLFILLIALSFLVADAIGVWYPWLGFFIVAFLCFGIGGLLAFVALKKIKKGSQIVPEQAISEARQTREALQADRPLETIDSVAVEEPTAGAAPAVVARPAKPADAAAADPDVVEAKQELKEARADAEELELDAKELKKRAKQEAKEAKEAAKAARVAEQEAAKADAIAAKAAEKADKEAAKAKAQAEKDAAKAAKAAEKQAKKGKSESEAPPTVPEVQAQPYTAPTPPQQPPAQPQAPVYPPEPPSDTSKPNDPKSDN
ncbi:MAG: phage holin family protein [Thermoleophilaceae bacterium]|nr:phage holin family protein [Thermoleophilaceae bacterium]